MTILAKAVSMWLVLLVAMTGNGILRVLLLQPRLGESLARQAACVSGMVLILGLTGLFVRRLAHPSGGQLLRIGLLWMVLTVGFEFLFGHYAAGASFEALLAEYNVMRGRLWPLVLLTTLLAPWLCDVVRPRSARII